MKYIKNNETAYSCSRSCFFEFETKLSDRFQKLFFDNLALPVSKKGLTLISQLLESHEGWGNARFLQTAKDLCDWFILTMEEHTELDGGYWTISIEERIVEINE